MKITLTDPINLQNETTAVNAIANNNTIIEDAFDNTLSRDGASPNQMEAALDMNSNHILNLPAPISADEPVRFTDIQNLTAGGTITFNSIPTGGTVGQALIKNSASNYDVSWKNPNNYIKPDAIASSYGTAAASIADSTAAINAGIATLVAQGGGVLELGVGVYKITSSININHNSIFIRGQGEKVTTILFQPSVSSAAITISSLSSNTISYTGISDLSISSGDTTILKTAINLTDVSDFYLDKVTVNSYPAGNLWTGGVNSTGLRINGRELGSVRNFTVYADNPLIIAPNPNSPISLDSWTFENCNFVAHLDTSSTNPCILTLDSTNLFNIHFSGAQNWQGGTNGFQWINTTASQASINISFSGIKSEQCIDAIAGSNAYTFFITTNNIIRGLDIQNCTAGDRNGIFLRNVLNPTIKGFLFDPVLPNVRGLDIDSSAGTVELEGCNWFTTTTASVVGLNLIQSSDTPAGFFLSTAIPPRVFYSTKTTETFSNINVNSVSSTGTIKLFDGTAVPVGGNAAVGIKFSNTSFPNFGVYYGQNAPTFSAAQGSIYMRIDGSSTSTRMYINSNGSTGWTNVVTAV